MKKLLLLLFIGIVGIGNAQTIEKRYVSVQLASSDDNFQPVMGTPYGASLSGAGGSLEVSASYGESNYEESSLSAEELSIQSNIRVFPNPTTYMVNVDLSQLHSGGVSAIFSGFTMEKWFTTKPLPKKALKSICATIQQVLTG